MKNRLMFSVFCLLSVVTACAVMPQTDVDVTPLVMPTPVVTAETSTLELAETKAVPVNGSDIANLLNDSFAPNESVEIDAYFSGANPFIMIGGPWTYYDDRINCPTYLNNLLTDTPFFPVCQSCIKG